MRKLKTIVLQTGVSCFITGAIFFGFMVVWPALKWDVCFISIFVPFLWILFIAGRISLFLLFKYKMKESNFIKFVLIIGTNDRALKSARFFDDNAELGIRVAGFLTNNEKDAAKTLGNHRVLALAEDLSAVLENNIVDCVLFAEEIDHFDQIRSLARRCALQGIDFGFTLAASSFGDNHLDFITENYGDISVNLIKAVPRSQGKLLVKRIFDILASSVFIMLCAPLWLIIPLLIRKDSQGSVLFYQKRVGKNGRRFIMYKFRSMVPDAEKRQGELKPLNEVEGPAFKMRNDPRITRIGKLLRRTSLDELPQLFNVLKGDMSMVGPRPPIFEEVLQYRIWEKKRLAVVPGITCLWQVSGRSELKFNEWMKLDIQYIESWSLTLDFKILMRTLPAVLSFKGAQ